MKRLFTHCFHAKIAKVERKGREGFVWRKEVGVNYFHAKGAKVDRKGRKGFVWRKEVGAHVFTQRAQRLNAKGAKVLFGEKKRLLIFSRKEREEFVRRKELGNHYFQAKGEKVKRILDKTKKGRKSYYFNPLRPLRFFFFATLREKKYLLRKQHFSELWQWP